MSEQKFTKDIWVIGITNIIIVLRSLILLPVITKILGADSYGIWVQIIAMLPLIALLTTLGLPYALVRFLAGEKNKRELRDGIFSVITIISVIIFLILLVFFFFSPHISSFLKWPETIVKVLAFIIFFECINFVFLHVFRALQQINLYSFFIIFQSLGEIGLTVAAILFGYGLLGAVIALLIVRIICFLVIGAVVLKQIGFAFPMFSKTKEHLRFGLPTVPGNISNWFVGFSDRYLVGYFLGLVFVGYYAPACTLGAVMGFLGAPFSFLLPAVVSKLHDENKIEDVKRYLKYSLKYFLAIAIPAFFGLSILAKKLLIILSTPEISAHGYLLIPFVTLGMLLYGVYGVVYLIPILSKKTALMGNIWIAAAVLNLALNLILIPQFGIIAAAINSMLSYTFILAVTWHYSLKYLRFDIDWRFIQKSIFASALMSLFVFLVNPGTIIQILFVIVTAAVLYFVLLALFKAFKKSEVIFFTSLFKRGRTV